MVAPVLIFGYGNPSRGDDALGPKVIEYLQSRYSPQDVELLTDFQLQIEHVLDLSGRRTVLFVDAAVIGDGPYALSLLQPERDNSYSSHAMSPSALLAVYQAVMGQNPPCSYMLSIRARSFQLGSGLSHAAAEHLIQACGFVDAWITQLFRENITAN
ncbi:MULTISPECIES: hydrogenase maturation protease [Methylomonas]|uniref:hydrogenase maturation protease n=1 Tax=Methylomonas TaxID=416 RepID=UPI001232CC77|nr:hydrogenase maturation protease [Methylomonas rhizoryzae]